MHVSEAACAPLRQPCACTPLEAAQLSVTSLFVQIQVDEEFPFAFLNATI